MMPTPVIEIPVEALHSMSRVAGFADGYCYILDILYRAKADPECPSDVSTFLSIVLTGAERSQGDVIGTYFQRITMEQTPRHTIN